MIQTKTRKRNIIYIWVPALIATLIIVPTPLAAQADETTTSPSNTGPAQTIIIADNVTIPDITRDSFSAVPSLAQQIRMAGASHTNYAWARVVLLIGGYPVNDHNVQVFLQWMRQENGVDDWWNRNNPLNNGWYTDGSYMGSNSDLYSAADKVARAIQNYPAMYASFMSGNVDNQAIMWSGWASGHYGDGTHWSQSVVPEIEAPASAWGE